MSSGPTLKDPKLPNLFDHARSELAQDAVIAYLLEWAKPNYSGPLHKLGRDLLQSLLYAVSSHEVASPADFRLKQLDVQTQANQADVVVQVNGRTYLIIEDKTRSKDHGGQIRRYKKQLQEQDPGCEVLAVYLKTGNESQRPLPVGADGFFFRPNLLEVLDRHPSTGNDIVEEFRSHLQEWENQTNAFAALPLEHWTTKSWQAWEGFFAWLQHNLDLADDGPVWDYVPNASGGFLGFWWHWQPLDAKPCELYLQIHHIHSRKQAGTPGIFIRAYGNRDADGVTNQVKSGLLWDLLLSLQSSIEQVPDAGLQLTKAGSFRGGKSAAVAELTFGSHGESFLVADSNGTLNKPATLARLKQAMDFLSRAAATVK